MNHTLYSVALLNLICQYQLQRGRRKLINHAKVIFELNKLHLDGKTKNTLIEFTNPENPKMNHYIRIHWPSWYKGEPVTKHDEIK